MMAMITQPIESSQIAEATMICPRLRRVKPISRTIAATILIEEMDKAVPRNREVSRRWSGCGRSESGSNWPRMKPQMKGTATPVTEMLSAALPTVRTSLRSVSMPVSNSSKRMPNWEMPSSMAFCSGALGKMACCKSGHSAPNTDGPSMMPPSSMPITDGWPMRFMASPKRRPTTISVMSWARKMTSEAPPLPPSAAKDGPAPSINARIAQPPMRTLARADMRRGVEQVMDRRGPSILRPINCSHVLRRRVLGRGALAPTKLDAIANYLQQGYARGNRIQHGCLIRAAKAIVFRPCLCRNRLAARAKHALARRSLRLGPHAAARPAVEEAAGLSRTRLPGRRRVHGSGQLGHLPRRRVEVRLRAADDRAAVQPNRDPVAVLVRAAGDWRWARSRAGLS